MSVFPLQFFPNITFEQLSDTLSGQRMIKKLVKAANKQKYLEYHPSSYEDILINYSILGIPSVYSIAEKIKYAVLSIFQYLGQFASWVFSFLNWNDLSHRIQLFSLSCKKIRDEIFSRYEILKKKTSFLNMIEFTKMYEDIESYGKDFLAPSVNRYSKRASSLAKQTKIPISMIKDRRVRDLTYGRAILDFSHPRGVCNGMSNFFIYLYFKTHSYFDNPEAHLVRLAKLFQRGAMEEAMVAQTLGQVHSKLWGLQEKDVLVYLSPNSYVMDPRLETLQQTKIENGIYKICLYSSENSKILTGHAMVLIKLSDAKAYIFDPNHGLIRRTGEDLNTKLFSFFTNHLKSFSNKKIEKVSVVLEKFSVERGRKRIKEAIKEEIVSFPLNSSTYSGFNWSLVYDPSFIPDRNILIRA